jgi:hypothetical protein
MKTPAGEVAEELAEELADALAKRVAGWLGRRLAVVGIAVASVVSWSDHHQVGKAILHGFLGWIYLLYRWLVS